MADSMTPSIPAISVHGADWKSDKFNQNSPALNFSKWSKSFKIHLSLLGLKSYVFHPLLSPPSTNSEPVAYNNWHTNDDLACAIILTALDEAEYEGLDKDKTAANLYDQVKTCAEGKGPVWMVALIQEVLWIQCSPSKLLTVMAKRICNIISRIFAIKALDEDLFRCVMLLNSLNDLQYTAVQTQVSRGLADATADSPYKSKNIRKLLETVQNLSSLKSAGSSVTTDTTLTAIM